MAPIFKAVSALVVAAFLVASAAPSALAITVELAKKCREMAVKTYPPKPAGSSKGSAQAERDFYQNCLAKDGKVDSPPAGTPATAPAEASPNTPARAPAGTPK